MKVYFNNKEFDVSANAVVTIFLEQINLPEKEASLPYSGLALAINNTVIPQNK
jgi:sulfur carrier protein ThiS